MTKHQDTANEFELFRKKVPTFSDQAAAVLFSLPKKRTTGGYLDRYSEYSAGIVLKQHIDRLHELNDWFDQWGWYKILDETILVSYEED
jgi:hypothetical protein